MKTKKRIVIESFANFDKETAMSVEKFYNYKPTKVLSNSLGVKLAGFPKTKTNMEEYNLNIAGADLAKVKGVTYFKQYFPRTGITEYRILLYGDDKKEYLNQLF